MSKYDKKNSINQVRIYNINDDVDINDEDEINDAIIDCLGYDCAYEIDFKSYEYVYNKKRCEIILTTLNL